MNVSSQAFSHDQLIPSKYTCEGSNASPPLMFSGQPGNTNSLALIVIDPDAPTGTFTHWIVYNMPSNTNSIQEGGLPPTCSQGVNDYGHMRYDGPCPPSGSHRYYFKLYALDSVLGIGPGVSRQLLESAMRGHIIDKAELVGKYEKNSL